MRGTGYAILEIIWWMAAAAILGLIIGWILRGRQFERNLAAWQQQLDTPAAAASGDLVVTETEDAAESAVAEQANDELPPDDVPESDPPSTGLPSKELATAKMSEIATRTRGASETVVDDLELIHGVGPKLDTLLKSMDITSFRQVARFTTDDIAYVTAALDAFPGRIERDDWMSSALEQHFLKYGEELGPTR
jgi:predicted flap endonuclease-1-like 5' DNA nuclease